MPCMFTIDKVYSTGQKHLKAINANELRADRRWRGDKYDNVVTLKQNQSNNVVTLDIKTLKDYGITKMESHRWQLEADILRR